MPDPVATSSALAAVVAQLQDALTMRRPAAVPPVVVPLGDCDVLSAVHDPWTTERGAAQVHLSSEAVLIGPWPFAASSTQVRHGCGLCLARRWQQLRPIADRQALEEGGPPKLAAGGPIISAFIADAIWLAYEHAVAAPTNPTDSGAWVDGWVTRVDLHSLHIETVPMLADPRCPTCSTWATDGDSPVLELQPSPKIAATNYRSRSVTEYRMPERALANRVCGAIGSTTTMNVVTPTTAPVSGRIRLRGSRGLADIGWSGQANSYRTSRGLALLEGLERYSGTHPRTARPIIASLGHLGSLALDPRDCGVYADATYAGDDALAPFDPEREIPWVSGYSLRDARPVLVPQKLVYYSTGDDADNFVFECSNGCATGSSHEEAILFGLLELIERDAFLLGWYTGADLPLIDVDGLDDPAVRTMVDRAAVYGYDVRLFDNRIDLPVPVCTALAIRRDGGDGLLGFASAASLHPLFAAAGAISEVLTYLPMLPRQVSVRRPELVEMSQDFSQVTALADHAALFGLPEMRRHAERYLGCAPSRPLGEVFRDWTAPGTTDLREDVRYCTDLLAAAGHATIVVDQTSPEQRAVGLSSVCVLAPGLLPIDFGWARQRALTMPRTARALAGRPLHSVPHPFP